jgi:hypothetical protein
MIQTEVSPLEDISQHVLFEENGIFQFVIPSIQRDYQWGIGSDSGDSSNDSAYAFIEDLIRYSEGATGHEDPYFLGTFIVYSSEHGNVNVMDGQQRWTTLTALMGAIYHLLDRGIDEDWSDVKEKISENYLINEEGLPFLLSKVPHDNSIIELISSFHGTEKLNSLPEEVREGSGSFSRISGGKSKRYKGRNLACVVDYFVDRLTDEFGLITAQSSRRRLVNFFNIISSRVLVNLTFTDTARVAFKMFITANARGTPLNNFDILRGLVLARNQILTGQDINSKFDRLFGVATSIMEELIDGRDVNKNKKIDKFISDSLTIYTGERVSKSGCLGVLENHINDIADQEGLFTFVGYFVSYLRRWRNIIQLSPRYEGMLEHSRIAYSQSQIPQHTVIYTAALIAEWSGDQLERLLKILQCFVMRSQIIGGKASEKEWYSLVPTFGYRILNPQGRTREQILVSLSKHFEESQYNPSDEELTAILSAKQFTIKSAAQKGALVALFHALEGALSYLTKGGQHIKVAKMMPSFDWYHRDSYAYGEEQWMPGLHTLKIGNIFAIGGTISDIDSIERRNVESRIGRFRERASGFRTTLEFLEDETEWGHEEIGLRTDWLTEIILIRFPHSCDEGSDWQ